jgi:hypothetical protein
MNKTSKSSQVHVVRSSCHPHLDISFRFPLLVLISPRPPPAQATLLHLQTDTHRASQLITAILLIVIVATPSARYLSTEVVKGLKAPVSGVDVNGVDHLLFILCLNLTQRARQGIGLCKIGDLTNLTAAAAKSSSAGVSNFFITCAPPSSTAQSHSRHIVTYLGSHTR